MNGRGGKRLGAGRKPILDCDGRLGVGIRCEFILNRIATARAELQLADDLSQTNLQEFWKWVNSIPVPKRKAFLASPVFRDHQASIAAEREKLNLTQTNGRYGVRRRVIREVTAWAEHQFGHRLRASYIEDCWIEYRGFLRNV